MATPHRRAPPPPAGSTSPLGPTTPSASIEAAVPPRPYKPAPAPPTAVADWSPVSAAPPRPPKPASSAPVALNPWQMTEEQRREQRMTPVSVDVASSEAALMHLRDSEAMAIASADAMYDQGEQIDRMSDTTANMSSQLTHADRLVKGIGSWKHTIKNTFTDVDDTTARKAVKGARRDEHGNVIADDDNDNNNNDDNGQDAPPAAAVGSDRPPRVRREFKPTAALSSPSESSPLPPSSGKLHEWGPKKPAATTTASRIPKEWSKKPSYSPGTVPLSSHASAEQQQMYAQQQLHVDESLLIIGNLQEINRALGQETDKQIEQLDQVTTDIDGVTAQLQRTNKRMDKIIG